MKEEKNKPWAFSRRVFCDGMRDGFPIALGYFAVSFSLGILAGNALPLRVVSALGLACSYLPGVSAMSDGTRTILLTVLISAAAAVLFPVSVICCALVFVIELFV